MTKTRSTTTGLLLLGVCCMALAGSLLAPIAHGADDAIDLNAADEQQLMSVPGIGRALARRILDFREEHGPFESVDDLLKVKGIGEKSLAKLRPHFRVGESR